MSAAKRRKCVGIGIQKDDELCERCEYIIVYEFYRYECTSCDRVICEAFAIPDRFDAYVTSCIDCFNERYRESILKCENWNIGKRRRNLSSLTYLPKELWNIICTYTYCNDLKCDICYSYSF